MPTSRHPHIERNSTNPPASPLFRLQLLGGLAVLVPGGASPGQQRRRLALLAIVATSRTRGVTRDRLTSLLSPESSRDSASHSLHQLLYYLRQQLRSDVFLGTDPLRLNSAVVTSDLDEFVAAQEHGELAKAAAIYGGPFLDGFHLNVAAFDEWVASERQRLATLHSETLQKLANEREAAGDRAAAISWWRRLATLDPLSGSAALGLMRALTAAGDASAALRHARQHAALVQTEMGSRPSRELEAFAARLQLSVRAKHDGRPSNGALPRVNRFALLPLRSEGSDSRARFFTEGLTREIISSLTRGGVAVIGYESVAKYTTAGAPLREIGRALDVDAIGTGTLTHREGKVELSLESADPASGENLWVSEISVDAAAISRLASDAAHALASWLLENKETTRKQLMAAPVTTAEAYTSYLLGLREAHRGTATATKCALDRLEVAIVQDSSFALAHAGLGLALTIAVDYAILPADEAFRRADPIIARALALNPNLGLAHLARARLLQLRDWNWHEAEVEYRRAVELEPNAQSFQTYGWFLEWYVGRAEEGVAMGERAVQLDPNSAAAHQALAWRLRGADQLERAADEARIGLALDSSSIDGYWILAEVFLRRGQFAEAEESARQYRRAGGDVPANSTTLGEILARTGRTAEATAYAARLSLLASRDGPSLIALARTEMSLGHCDRALSLLERAVRERVFTIPFQPYWDPIRSDARFQAVMRAQGLEPR